MIDLRKQMMDSASRGASSGISKEASEALARAIDRQYRPEPEKPGLFNTGGPLGIAQIPLDLLRLPGAVVGSAVKELGDISYSAAGGTGQSASINDFFSQIREGKTGGEYIQDWGGTGNKWLDRAAGFVWDMGTDPLSYVGAVGAGALSKGGTRALGQMVASDTGYFAARFAANKGDDVGVQFVKRLDDAQGQVDELTRISTQSPSTQLAQDLAAAKARRQAIADEATEALSPYSRQVQDASNRMLTGSPISSFKDDALVNAFVPNSSGLRLRPFWRSTGGPQILSQKAWSDITSVIRPVTSRVVGSKSWNAMGDKFQDGVTAGFRAMGNAMVQKYGADVSKWSPEVADYMTAVGRTGAQIDLADAEATAALAQFGDEMTDLIERVGDDPSLKQAWVDAVTTPSNKWADEIPQQTKQLEAAGLLATDGNGATFIENTRDFLKRFREWAVSEGVEVGDFGDTYFTIMHLRSTATKGGKSASGLGTMQRRVTKTYMGQQVDTIAKWLDSIDPKVVKAATRRDKTINVPKLLKEKGVTPFPQRAWQDELETIARSQLGDDWARRFEKDPSVVLRAYVDSMAQKATRARRAKISQQNGLIMTEEAFNAAANLQKIAAKLGKSQKKLAGRLQELTETNVKRDQLLAAIGRALKDGDAQAAELLGDELDEAVTVLAQQSDEIVAQLRATADEFAATGTKKGKEFAAEINKTLDEYVAKGEEFDGVLRSLIDNTQELVDEASSRPLADLLADAQQSAARGTAMVDTADAVSGIAATADETLGTVRAQAEQARKRLAQVEQEIERLQAATGAVDDLAPPIARKASDVQSWIAGGRKGTKPEGMAQLFEAYNEMVRRSAADAGTLDEFLERVATNQLTDADLEVMGKFGLDAADLTPPANVDEALQAALAERDELNKLVGRSGGTRTGTLDKAAKNTAVSAARRNTRLLNKVDEIGVDAISPSFDPASTQATRATNRVALEEKLAAGAPKSGTQEARVYGEVLDLHNQAEEMFRAAESMALDATASKEMIETLNMLGSMFHAEAKLKDLFKVVDEIPILRNNLEKSWNDVMVKADKYAKALEAKPMRDVLMEVTGGQLRSHAGYIGPDELIKGLEAMDKFNDLPKFVQIARRFLNWWKGYAVLSPGFHVRNFYSGLWNNFVAGVPVSHTLKFGNSYYRMVRGQTPRSKMDETVKSLMDRGFMPRAGLGRYSEEMTTGNVVTRGSRRFGNHVENILRGSQMSWVEAQSGGMNQAARAVVMRAAVNKFHFDYENIGSLDKTMKMVSPFWVWQSRNFALQLELMVHKPQPLMAFMRLKENLSSDYDGTLTPDWYGERSYMPFDLFGPNIFLTPDIPTVSFLDEVAAIGEADLGQFASGLAPYFKIPIEGATKRDLFTGRELGDGATVPFPEVWMPLAPVLAPWISNDPGTGEQVLNSRVAQAVSTMWPILPRTQRLFPSDPKGQERALSAWFSTAGIPVRQLTEREMVQVLRNLRYEERDAKADPVEQARERQGRYDEDATEVQQILSGMATAPGGR